MPRGVYERKPKGDKAVAAKKNVAKKVTAAKVETKAAPKQAAPTLSPEVQFATVGTGKVAESMFGFQILGANINTLCDAYKTVQGSALAEAIGIELLANIETLKALRIETFGGLLEEKKAPAVEAAPAPVKETKAETKSVPAPVAAAAPSLPQPAAVPAPVLPQGNASFTPPAPPPLPQH